MLFDKLKGKSVQVRFMSGRSFVGELTEVNKDGVVIQNVKEFANGDVMIEQQVIPLHSIESISTDWFEES